MKKVILSVMVMATLLATGCKKAAEAGKDLKDATVEAADKAADATKDAANAVVDGTKDATNSAVDGVKDMANKAGDAIDSAINGVSIPKFEDPKVGEHLNEYANYAKDYIEAKGDVLKKSSLAKKGVELATKSKEILSNLDDKAAAKFKATMNAIQSKMAPAK